MDTEIMLRILRDADIEGDILCFCNGLSEYREIEGELRSWYKRAEESLGYPFFSQLEAAINKYYSWQCTAYYAFGLGLRSELKQALMLL